jgi:hypothetical protein
MRRSISRANTPMVSVTSPVFIPANIHVTVATMLLLSCSASRFRLRITLRPVLVSTTVQPQAFVHAESSHAHFFVGARCQSTPVRLVGSSRSPRSTTYHHLPRRRRRRLPRHHPPRHRLLRHHLPQIVPGLGHHADFYWKHAFEPQP